MVPEKFGVSSKNPLLRNPIGLGGVHTSSGRVEGLHVEDVDTLDLAEQLQALKTGRLLEIRGDGASGGTGSDKVASLLDLYFWVKKQLISTSRVASPHLRAIPTPGKKKLTVQRLVGGNLLPGITCTRTNSSLAN